MWDKKAGKGGSGIEIKNGGIFEKQGYGLLEISGGNGGVSGSFIDGENIKGFNGGNSGSLINSNNLGVKAEIGNITIEEAIGGLGGNKIDKKIKVKMEI